MCFSGFVPMAKRFFFRLRGLFPTSNSFKTLRASLRMMFRLG